MLTAKIFLITKEWLERSASIYANTVLTYPIATHNPLWNKTSLHMSPLHVCSLYVFQWSVYIEKLCFCLTCLRKKASSQREAWSLAEDTRLSLRSVGTLTTEERAVTEQSGKGSTFSGGCQSPGPDTWRHMDFLNHFLLSRMTNRAYRRAGFQFCSDCRESSKIEWNDKGHLWLLSL